MNKQSCLMLNNAMAIPGHEISLEDCASTLEVSVRSVRNYMADIDEFLNKNNLCDVFSNKNGFLVFTGDANDSARVSKAFAGMDFYEYRLNSQERQELMTILLILSDHPTKIAFLEEMFYSSKATIQSDLEEVRKYLEKFALSFDKNKHKGLFVCGKEHKKRDAILSALSDLGVFATFPWENENLTVISNFVNKLLRCEKFRYKCEQTLKAGEGHFHLTLLDRDFYEITLTLCIILFRLEHKYYVDAPQQRTFSLNGLCINLSEHVFRNLSSDVTVREEEIQYFANRLHLKKLILNHESEDGKHVNFHIVVKSLLYKLSLEYKNDLVKDYKLHEYLTGHIFSVYHRAKENKPLRNPFKDQMIRDYGYDYAILKKNIGILENGLGCTFSDDEITYMLMHIIAALERSYEKMPIPDVIIACNTGVGTANFLATIVKKNFSVNLVGITSSHAIDVLLARQRCDLIISTVPLLTTKVPWVQVGAVPSEQDLKRLKNALGHAASKIDKSTCVHRGAQNHFESIDNEEKNLRFVDLLKENHILLDKEVNNWKEAIITCAEPMLFDGDIESTYLSEMVNVVLENGPYIVFAPGVAIAHADPKMGVNRFSASFLRLKYPVVFHHKENDPVKFILSVAVNDDPQCTNALFHIMNIMVNPLAISKLSAAESPTEVIEILKDFEHASENLIGKEEEDG